MELREGLSAAGVAAAVTGELLAAGAAGPGAPWAPLNAVAPLLLSPETAEERDWHPLITPVGAGITFCGIAGWALLHHRVLAAIPGSPGETAAGRLAAGALSAAALAFFDYRLLPPRRRPRFHRWLPAPAIAAKYAVLAAALALTTPPRPPGDESA